MRFVGECSLINGFRYLRRSFNASLLYRIVLITVIVQLTRNTFKTRQHFCQFGMSMKYGAMNSFNLVIACMVVHVHCYHQS